MTEASDVARGGGAAAEVSGVSSRIPEFHLLWGGRGGSRGACCGHICFTAAATKLKTDPDVQHSSSRPVVQQDTERLRHFPGLVGTRLR